MPVDFIPTIIPTPEINTQNPQQIGQTEVAPVQETAPIPATTPTDTSAADQPTAATATADTTQQPVVVDKTKEPEKLHPVDSNADTLTTIADKEEEEFIENVMEEHKS